MAAVSCAETGCVRGILARGYCRSHYTQRWKRGEFAGAPRMIRLTGQTFGNWTVIGTAGIATGTGTMWMCRCSCGTERYVRSGSLRKTGGSRSCLSCANSRASLNGWPPCTYHAAHKRCATVYGKASSHKCSTECGRIASDWAYQHNDPNELHADEYDRRSGVTRNVAYSPDPQYYKPMCRSCHTRLDLTRASIETI